MWQGWLSFFGVPNILTPVVPFFLRFAIVGTEHLRTMGRLESKLARGAGLDPRLSRGCQVRILITRPNIIRFIYDSWLGVPWEYKYELPRPALQGVFRPRATSDSAKFTYLSIEILERILRPLPPCSSRSSSRPSLPLSLSPCRLSPSRIDKITPR